MDRDRARELLPIIQAYVDGAELEFRNKTPTGYWRLPYGGVPTFNDDTVDYRIKPEPRVFYHNIYREESANFGNMTKESAISGKIAGNGMPSPHVGTIKLIEVIEP